MVRATMVSGDCDEVICAGWGEPGGQWTQTTDRRRTQHCSI